ncbi:endonuclease III domain-containing protein [Sulfuracidifex metallicus DSM 6482 = JCM 9184]|nr:endonuclease III domain-containing protein [Sulfuracidifex metallicus DSM 6482 = JCM 9184]
MDQEKINQTIKKVLDIFKENMDLIKDKGWIVSEPESPRWWGGLQSGEEIIISSILVQMTRWETVAKVISEMRENGLTNFGKLSSLSEEEIYLLIRRVNFSRTKAKRLKVIADKASSYASIQDFIDDLKGVQGIGQETYYSLLLFVGNRIYFPPSEYGSRVLSRVTSMRIPKLKVKEVVESSLPKDLFTYKLFHAGLVTVGRVSCFKQPKCEKCILKMICNLNKNNETLRI